MNRSILTLALASLVLAGASSAQAWFEVCNNRNVAFKWSHLKYDPSCSQLRAQGWWRVEPGGCARVWDGDARGAWYYRIEAVDGSFTLPPKEYAQNLYVTPADDHSQCLWRTIDVPKQPRPPLDVTIPVPPSAMAHYQFQTLDRDARVSF